MKRITFIIASVLLLYAFREYTDFEKQLIGNFTTFVRDLPQEKIYLHTDKSIYTVGEKVWFRAYELDAALNVPVLLSRYVYVDLVDKGDSLVERVKVAAQDSVFVGQLELPEGLQQGDYCLRAYTYNMQNAGDDYIFKKKIRVINPKDSQLWTDVTYKKVGRTTYVARIRFTDNAGDPYVHLPMVYLTGERINRYSENRARTNRDGVIEVRIDTTVRTISLKSGDYAEVGFERDIHVPRQLDAFDVQFFPEGGSLLSNNFQTVAFKAIGQDGRAVEATGTIYQGEVPIAEVATEHDGMGRFTLPVTAGQRYTAVMRSRDSMDFRFEFPVPDDEGWGLAVEATDTAVHYRVLGGAEAVMPENFYLVLHSRGVVLAMERVRGKMRGMIDTRMLPEGIAHLLLMDDQGSVYSQRIFFHKFKRRPGVEIRMSKPVYTSRDLVEMEIAFEEPYRDLLEGSFSLTVTDDQKVTQDSLEDNILSNLLLTSDIRGYIDNPGYYFNDTTAVVDRHLDLVMLTHGWTRFDPSKIARGEFPEQKYEVEVGQVISGRVKNFWGGKSKEAEITVISDHGHVKATTTDSSGHFVVDGFAFRDGTEFLVQARNRKGRKSVQVELDDDNLLAPHYTLPNTMSQKDEEDDFLKRFSQDYYYVDGVKVYVLDEVSVVSKEKRKIYSFYDNLSTYSLDSATIAECANLDWYLLVQELPGVTIERGDGGEEYFARFGKELYTLVNDFEEPMEFIKLIPIRAVRQISYLDAMQAQIFFGDRAKDGALIISMDPGYTPPPRQRPNLEAFTPLGIQQPEEFYVPRYDVDSVRRSPTYDVRTTIYWQPVVELTPEGAAKVSFYTGDVYGSYSVIVEGVTRNGIVCRRRVSIPIK